MDITKQKVIDPFKSVEVRAWKRTKKKDMARKHIIWKVKAWNHTLKEKDRAKKHII
jgi:hypothetical protein